MLLLLVAAWLLVPRAPGAEERAPPVRVLVVDASASVVRTRPDWLPWVRGELRREAEAAGARGEDVAVVSFASEVGQSFPPAPPAAFLDRLAGRDGRPFDPRAGAGDDGESRLASALEAASHLVLAPGRVPGAVVILGTETTTGDDPAAMLAALARAGVSVERRRAPAAVLSELGVRELVLPARVEAGAPLAATVRLVFVPPGNRGAGALGARLEVDVTNAGLTRRVTVPLELPLLGGPWEVPVDCGSAGFGRTEVRVKARLAPGPDPLPENDTARAATRADGELVVGVVAEADRLAEARAWLAPSGASGLGGIQLVFAARDELPALFDGLDELDALVSFDLAPRRLPGLLVAAHVARGGGWLAAGGWRFLESWIPGATDEGLADLLPMEPAPMDQGPRDVVLLVDGSGSMEGEPFEIVRAAALDLVAAALPSDEVALRFFTGGLEPAHVVKPRSGRFERGETRGADDTGEAARRLLGLRVPRGQTYILASLEGFAAERGRASHEALALLLTDGLEREEMADPAGRAAALLAELGRAGARLRVLAIGERADVEFLELLTADGEEVLRPAGLEDLRAIFRREISGARWREAPAIPVRWSPAPAGSIARSIGGPAPADGIPLPPVQRLVRDAVRPGAEVLWESDRGEPVLALQRVGAGRTACLATLPAAGWAPAWTGRAGLGEPLPFAGLLRWLARGPRDTPGAPGAAAAGSRSVRAALGPDRIDVVGLDATWPAAVAARVLDVAAAEPVELARLRLHPPPGVGAGGPGGPRGGTPLSRRAGALDALLARRIRAAEAVLALEGPGGTTLLPLLPGLAPEFAGGGRALEERDLAPPEGGGGAPAPPARVGHPAGPWVLAAGLALLFASALALGSLGRGGQAGQGGQGIRGRGR